MVKSEMLIEEYTGESEEVTRLQLAQEIQKKNRRNVRWSNDSNRKWKI